MSENKKNIIPHFLDDDLIKKKEKVDFYSLSKEFIKTKKNRPFKLFSTLLLFITALVVSTVLLAGIIKTKTTNLRIDITDFEDINLKEIVAIARDASKLISQAETDKAILKGKYEKEIEGLQLQFALERKKIKGNRGISSEQKAQLLRELKQKESGQVSSLQKKFRQKLSNKESEIARQKSQLSEYKKRMNESLKAQERSLAVKLKALEAEKSTKIQTLEGTLTSRERELALLKSKIRELNTKKRESSGREIKNLKDQLKEIKIQVKQLKTALTNRRNEFITLMKKLERYKYAFAHYSSLKGEHGYIIDARNTSSLLLEMNPFIHIKNRDTALVVNESGKIIAHIEMKRVKNEIRGKVVKKLAKGSVKPFHTLIVKKRNP